MVFFQTDSPIFRWAPFVVTGKILLFYPLWILGASLLLLFGYPFAHTSFYDVLSIVAFMLLALGFSMFFRRVIEPYLETAHRLRLFFILLTLLFLAGLYFFVRFTGYKNVWILTLVTADLMVIACLVGSWMTHPLQKPVDIVPLCFIAATADVFSVLAGPTKDIEKTIAHYYETGMTDTLPFADFLLVKMPVVGVDAPMPLFGVSDWIIVIFLIAAARKFNMNDTFLPVLTRKAIVMPLRIFFPASALGLFIAIFLAWSLGFFIPALPVVCAVYLGFLCVRYPEMRRLGKKEVVPMGLFAVLIFSYLLYCHIIG